MEMMELLRLRLVFARVVLALSSAGLVLAAQSILRLVKDRNS